MARFFLIGSSIFGFLSVALGAFGAHALKTRFDDYQMSVYQTGVQYQFFHTFALALIGILLLRPESSSLLRASGFAFLIGICVFSGSLYLLAFTKIKILGAITPFGGVGLLMGWILLGISLWKTDL